MGPVELQLVVAA